MEFEALLPVAALGAGIAALALAPVIGALGNTEVSKSLSETGRNLTKNGIKMGIEAYENVQATLAEAGETWNDIVAEAKTEVKAKKTATATEQPTEVEIIG